MTTIADQSNMPVWDIPWTALALLASACAFLLLAGLIRAAARPAPKYAPSAQETPAPAPTGARPLTREQQQCFQRGHVVPDWARTPTHLICVRCEESWPRDVDDFDQHSDQAMAIVNPPTPDEVLDAAADDFASEFPLIEAYANGGTAS